MRTSLIVGNTSKIGRALLNNCPDDLRLISAGRRNQASIYLDLSRGIDCSSINGDFDSAVILAGLTNISYIDSSRPEADRVNLTNTIELIQCLNNQDIPCLFVSSSCVFSNAAESRSEQDIRNPSTYYGDLKARVEDYVLNSHPQNSVVRLTKIIDDSFFVYSWITDLRKGHEVSAFTDLKVSPVHINNIIDVFYEWCLEPHRTIIHISNAQEVSYFEWIHYLASELDLSTSLIAPTTSISMINRPIFMPNDSRLECRSSCSKLLDIQSTLDIMINRMRQRSSFE